MKYLINICILRGFKMEKFKKGNEEEKRITKIINNT